MNITNYYKSQTERKVYKNGSEFIFKVKVKGKNLKDPWDNSKISIYTTSLDKKWKNSNKLLLKLDDTGNELWLVVNDGRKFKLEYDQIEELSLALQVSNKIKKHKTFKKIKVK